MKYFYHSLLISVLFLFSCTEDRIFQENLPDPNLEIIHYWDFNDTNNLTKPKITTGNTALTYAGAYFDDVEGSPLNARDNSEAGFALRLRNPAGDLIVSLPTLGYKDVELSYAVMRTGNGAKIQKVSYSIDGSNFITTGISENEFAVTEVYTLKRVSFKNVLSVTNNANFKIKIVFEDGSANPTGNNRIDNFVLEGIPSGDPIPTPNPTPTPSVLLHYWHFNNLPSGTIANPVNADFSLLNPITANITYPGTGAGFVDLFSPGSDVNLRNDFTAGNGIRFRNPSDTRSVIVAIPTTGYKDIVVKFATARTGSGPENQNYSYSIDGTNYITTNLATTTYSPQQEPTYEMVTLDMSNVSGANNNANLKLRIQFAGSNASLGNGNSRYDNLSVDAKSL